jgi:hypothetical protein
MTIAKGFALQSVAQCRSANCKDGNVDRIFGKAYVVRVAQSNIDIVYQKMCANTLAAQIVVMSKCQYEKFPTKATLH